MDLNPPSSARAEQNAEHVAATQLILDAGRELGRAAVLFHSAVAEKQGLSAIEEKTLDLLQSCGPLTAGELGDKSGLAPASVTGLINRLEKKGFVQRQTDAEDGRKVRVALIEARLHAFYPLFIEFVTGIQSLCKGYSASQLQLIARFFREIAQVQMGAAAKLAQTPTETL